MNFKPKFNKVKLGPLIQLTEDEIEKLKTAPNHYDKLGLTQASTSASPPLRVLQDLTSRYQMWVDSSQ